MFVKSTVLALAAVAALGATMLTASTTSADAGVHRGGGHFRGHIGGHIRHDFRRPGRWIPRHPRWSGPLWRHRHIYIYPRRVVYARPVIYSAAPTVNRCTCLTKQYLPTGAVMFKDVCTNEAAINPPPAPVQTGYAPQPQSATGAPIPQ
jgi:hypothetical protein